MHFSAGLVMVPVTLRRGSRELVPCGWAGGWAGLCDGALATPINLQPISCATDWDAAEWLEAAQNGKTLVKQQPSARWMCMPCESAISNGLSGCCGVACVLNFLLKTTSPVTPVLSLQEQFLTIGGCLAPPISPSCRRTALLRFVERCECVLTSASLLSCCHALCRMELSLV